MNINDFFDIAEEFFDKLNPNFCEDYFEENSECEFLKICDARAKIPLAGKIASLNVSVATGVILYEAIRQRG